MPSATTEEATADKVSEADPAQSIPADQTPRSGQEISAQDSQSARPAAAPDSIQASDIPPVNQADSHPDNPDPPNHDAAGPRAARFLELFDRTLTKTLSIVTYANFASCFPVIAAAAPASLQALHSNFAANLDRFARSDFDKILAERAVVQRLNALEELLATARRRLDRAIETDSPPVPAHLLPPAALMAAHRAPQLAQQQRGLEARLRATQAHNAQLAGEVARQRDEIAALVAGLQRNVADLDGAVDKLAGVGDDLRMETRALDEAVAGL